ncbi:TPA: AHH domain-containing protein [Vibrio vulnificus]
MASLKTLKSDYKTLLRLSKYNVNHPRNIVGLPTSPLVACQLNVPLHYSSHTSDAIPTIEDSPSYHVISSMLILTFVK